MSDNNTNNNTSAMYCHACHNQWQQQADGIECPACRSSSTEIITAGNDPRHFHNRPSLENEAPVQPEAQPAPAANSQASEDQEILDAPSVNASQNTSENASQSPSTGTQTQPSRQEQTQQPHHAPRPEFVFMVPPPAFTVFTTTIVSDTHVPPPNAAGPRGPPVTHIGLNFFFPPMPHMPHGPTPTAPPSTGTTTPGQAAETTTQENPQPQEQAQQAQQSPQREATGMPPMGAGFLGALLSSLFNPAAFMPPAGIFGDAVYSQEALDRIISQLREQSGPGGAPPASQAAIDKLEVRELDEKMLGGETKTRCVICVDEMGVGEKASVLPCSHFFHGECVTPWLKQHNTCPVCRRSVETEETKPGKAAEFAGTEAPQHAGAMAGCP